MVTVSIITPLYATQENKRLDLFDKTVKSVIKQSTNSNLVHIVIDDGSTVDIEGPLNEYKDYRLRYMHRERSSSDLKTPSNALNMGIDYCLSKSSNIFSKSERDDLGAVTVLHSDDLLTPNSIEGRINQLTSGFVYTDKVLFDEKKLLSIMKGKEYNEKKKTLNPSYFLHFNHHTIMWEINFLKYLKDFAAKKYMQDGIFDHKLYFGEDRDISISSFEAMIESGCFKTRYIPFISYLYRLHENSISRETTSDEIKTQNIRINEKHFGYSPSQTRKQLQFQRILSGLPWSLFTYLPEDTKKVLRPFRNFIKTHAFKLSNPELASDLEQQILAYK